MRTIHLLGVRPDPVSEKTDSGIELPKHLQYSALGKNQVSTFGTVVSVPEKGFVLEHLTTNRVLPHHFDVSEPDVKGFRSVSVRFQPNIKVGDRVAFHYNLVNRLREEGLHHEDVVFMEAGQILYVVDTPPRAVGDTIICQEIPEKVKKMGDLILTIDPKAEVGKAIVRSIGYDWNETLGGLKPGMTIYHNMKKHIPLPMPNKEEGWIRMAGRNIIAAHENGITEEEFVSRVNESRELTESIRKAITGKRI